MAQAGNNGAGQYRHRHAHARPTGTPDLSPRAFVRQCAGVIRQAGFRPAIIVVFPDRIEGTPMRQPPWQIGVGNERATKTDQVRPSRAQCVLGTRLRVTTGINHRPTIDDPQGLPEGNGHVRCVVPIRLRNVDIGRAQIIQQLRRRDIRCLWRGVTRPLMRRKRCEPHADTARTNGADQGLRHLVQQAQAIAQATAVLIVTMV